MSDPARKFGKPQIESQQALDYQLKYQEQVHVQSAGQALKDAGVTHSPAANQNTPARRFGQASPAQHGQDVRRDMGVSQGERPALSPDDRMRQAVHQAKGAGQQLAASGVEHSPAQKFGQQVGEPGAPNLKQDGPKLSR